MWPKAVVRPVGTSAFMGVVNLIIRFCFFHVCSEFSLLCDQIQCPSRENGLSANQQARIYFGGARSTNRSRAMDGGIEANLTVNKHSINATNVR